MTRVLVMPHKQRVEVPEDLRGWMTLFDLPSASVFAYATAYCSYVLTVGGPADSYPGMPSELFELRFDTPDLAREWILQDSVRPGAVSWEGAMSTPLQEAVARYQAEGFGRPHPIPTREKGPVIKGWQDPEKTFGLEEFVLTS